MLSTVASMQRPHGTPRQTGIAFLLSAVAALAAPGLGGCGQDAAPESPASLQRAAAGKNLLIVLLDAAASRHFGCYGYDRDTTPHLDRVAAESVVFDNAYAQASGTMRSVYSFFTSRHPVFSANIEDDYVAVLSIPPAMTTMAEYMAARYEHRLGYTSNTWMKREFGHDQGFTHYWQIWDFAGKARGFRPKDRFAIPRLTRWMRRTAPAGFFAYLHFMRPHVPHDQPEPFFSRFTNGPVDRKYGRASYVLELGDRRPSQDAIDAVVGLYDGNLAYVDELVGAMIADLDSAGVWQQTVFVLMADHGQGLFHDGKPPGHGGNVYETVLRVPLFIRIPGVTPRRVTEPVELVDLLPTLLEILGIDAGGARFAGRSLVPLMTGQPVPGELSSENRIIHARTNRRMPPTFTVRRGRYKLIYCPEPEHRELYDLQDDPAELSNLLRVEPHHPAAEQLQSYLDDWLASAGEQGALKGNADFDAFDARDLERLRALGYLDGSD